MLGPAEPLDDGTWKTDRWDFWSVKRSHLYDDPLWLRSQLFATASLVAATSAIVLVTVGLLGRFDLVWRIAAVGGGLALLWPAAYCAVRASRILRDRHVKDLGVDTGSR